MHHFKVYDQPKITMEDNNRNTMCNPSDVNYPSGVVDQSSDLFANVVELDFNGGSRINYNNVTVTRGPRRLRTSYSCTVDPETYEDAKEFPMYIAMADLCITPTGFTDPKLRETICTRINLMCGEVSMAYTSKTTHVLAAHANTTKVELARERNLPVVTVEWIENIWNTCKQNLNPYIHASLANFKTCDFSIFFNLHFTFSKRYDLDTKQFYENLLTLHGGTIGATLKKDSTHFYICQEPESERWYHYSQERQIPCVPLAWIIESIDRKTLAKVAEYEIRGTDLVGFGTTFNVYDADQRLLLPKPITTPPPPYCGNQGNQPTMNDFDPGAFLGEIDNFVYQGDITNNSTTLLANDITCDEQKMNAEEDISILDETVVDANDGKDSLVDSLTFSLAG